MSSGFFTEAETDKEAKKQGEEEREKVRKPDDPLEAPKQQIDSKEEEEKELDDYRNREDHLQEKSLNQKLQAGENINKSTAVSGDESKRKTRETDEKEEEVGVGYKKAKTDATNANDVSESINNSNIDANDSIAQSNSLKNTGLVCIGILPGLGHYQDSSSDECSSDSDHETTLRSRSPNDLLRDLIKQLKKKKKHL